MRAGRASRRLPAKFARLTDRLLDLVVLAFAAWTLVYHLFLVLDLGAVAAAVAGTAGLVPSAWLAFRTGDAAGEPEREPIPSRDGRALPWSWPRVAAVLSLHALAAVGVAALFAFGELGWWGVWSLLAATAAVAVALAAARATGRVALDPLEGDPARSWEGPLETMVVLAWTVALAALSLFLVRPAADDAFYGRQASWIAEHGRLPLRDVLFSDEVFDAIIYPPVSSIEALVGTVGHVAGLAVPNLLFFGLTPLASALSVLAMWRLLRRWAVPLVGLSLSVALLFLLMTAQDERTFGNLFIGRIWEGKIVFVAVLVPLLFVLLSEYVERPTRRGLALLAAAGIGGVGLTSSGSFLVPVVAAGCLAPVAVRAPRRAALALAAAGAYPLGALAVRAGVGGRRAATDVASDVDAGELVHVVPGRGWTALVAVTAMLVAPFLIRRTSAALMTAATVLLVVCLYAPSVPRLIWELTDIGRVLWRLNWAVPTAVLVGVLATGLPVRGRRPALRALPAMAVAAILIGAGTPLWSAIKVAREPAWKVSPGTLPAARRILADARPGDVILAPRFVSQTILLMSGEVTTVAPRIFYARALEAPAAYADERVVLQSFAELGPGGPVLSTPGRRIEVAEVVRALRLVRPDLACIVRDEAARRLLVDAGYSPVSEGRELVCLRAPPGGPGTAPG